jgi:hypothetical protein
VAAVERLSNARKRMEQLASEKPGSYFIFSGLDQKILVKIETPHKRIRPFLIGPTGASNHCASCEVLGIPNSYKQLKYSVH